MGRNWQYPRWRRLLMQGAMCAVLGATVALAALVDRRRHAQNQVPLGPAIDCGGLSIRLPAGWAVERVSGAAGLLGAVLPQPFPLRRSLVITVTPPSPPGMLPGLLDGLQPGETLADVPFGDRGSAGTVRVWARQLTETMPHIEAVATARLPMAEVTIRSDWIAAGDVQSLARQNVDLIEAVAASVRTK